jgi:glycosyltransferase involved in cell wall biosynthesis
MKSITVLTFVNHYLPSFKSGGPVRTLSNMVDQLQGDINFKIICLDRDSDDIKAFEDIKVNKWNDVNGAQVFYIAPNIFSLYRIFILIREADYDIVYLNSFFDFTFSIYPLLVRFFCYSSSKKWILAPRGEFSVGALTIKLFKKKLFLLLIRYIPIYKKLIWHASTSLESSDILLNLPFLNPHIAVAIDLPSLNFTNFKLIKSKSSSDIFKILFISRISEKKNLHFALNILSMVKSTVEFNIYGPIRDIKYWNFCSSLISDLPNNIHVTYYGPVTPDKVSQVIATHDLFFFPTLGENYGHVIAESLSCGTPVLISNTTPWLNLSDSDLGWDFSLDNPSDFIDAIEFCAKLDYNYYNEWRNKISKNFSERLKDPKILKDNLMLFKSS